MPVAIEMTQVNKCYPVARRRSAKGLQALDQMSLVVEKGDFYGLLGPNGAGKSTTLGILTGLVRKDSGTVRVMGVDWDQDPQRAKAFLGVIPQDFNFNGFEKVEDILFQQAGYYGLTRSQSGDQIDFLLERLGLEHKRHQPGRTLSGGMRRRLLIARGLVHKPEIVLFDEPTAGVDVLLRHTLWDFMREINHQGTTIVLTTHYLEEAEKLCHNVGFLNQGRLVNQMSKWELRQQEVPMSVQLVLKSKPDEAQLPLQEGFEPCWFDEEQVLSVRYPSTADLGAYIAALHQAGHVIIGIQSTNTRLEALLLSYSQNEV